MQLPRKSGLPLASSFFFAVNRFFGRPYGTMSCHVASFREVPASFGRSAMSA